MRERVSDARRIHQRQRTFTCIAHLCCQLPPSGLLRPAWWTRGGSQEGAVSATACSGDRLQRFWKVEALDGSIRCD